MPSSVGRGVVRSLWYNRSHSREPRSLGPCCPTSRPSPASATTATRPAPASGARRSTLRRGRRRRARRARGRAPAQLGPADPPARRARRDGDRYDRGRRRVRDAGSDDGVARRRSAAALLHVPDGVPRPARRGPPHPRRDRRARGCPKPGADDVLPHERTLPKAKSDRLVAAAGDARERRPDLGPHARRGPHRPARAARRRWQRARTATASRHELGAIDDPDAIAAITALVGSAPLVLADGHHRFETACNYRDERAPRACDDPGAAAIMCFVVELVDDELTIEPIHRLVDLPDRHRPARRARRRVRRSTTPGPVTPEAVDALTARMRADTGSASSTRSGLALAVPAPGSRARPRSPASTRRVAATDAARRRSARRARACPTRPGSTATTRTRSRRSSTRAPRAPRSSARPVTVAETRAAAIDRVAHAAEDDVLLRPSRAPEWSSARSTERVERRRLADATRWARSGAAPSRSAGPVLRGRRRRAGAASRPRSSAGRPRGTRRPGSAWSAGRRGATARTRATGRRGARRARRAGPRRRRRRRTISASPNSFIVTPNSLLRAEADRLAVLQVDEHVRARVLVEDRVERAVVEDVAVLVDLDERRALVLVGTR